jgi:hypothetical protein
MVEVFDRSGASFSAVNQQINSATSMGRLMLNVLHSFAQFEREVTLQQIIEATNWQVHTVRGTLAGAFKKKLGLTITSTKDAGGQRV